MRLLWVRSLGVIVVGLLTWLPGAAMAEGLPLSKTVQAGKPLRPLKISVEAGEPVVVTAGGKRHEIPLRAASGASVESVAVAPDGAVTVVRVEGANGTWALLLGGRAGNLLLASGRTDWAGDPGERRMFSLESSAADKAPRSVRFGMRYEGLSMCRTTPALLAAKRVDPTTLEAVPDLPSVADATSQEVEIEVVSGPRPQPTLLGLEPAGSSRVDDTTAFYLLPRALLDGNRQTTWALARGDFATLRWTQRAVAIQQLEIDLALPGNLAATSLLLLSDGDRAVRIPLPPAGSGQVSGERPAAAPPPAATASSSVTIRVKPKAPWTTGCLTLLNDDLPPGATLAVEDVRGYTDLDQPGSVDRLVSLVVQDGAPGADAADLLAALGDVGALAVASRFDELSVRGKRRGLRVLAKGLAQPPVMARVLNTAREGERDLSDQALSILQGGGEAGRVGLRELALDASELGDAAAKLLSQRAGEIPTLLQALNGPGGSERPGLRSALSVSARRDPQGFATSVESWLAQSPSTAARASLALAASTAGASGLALRLAQPAWVDAGASEFSERYRFANALAAADASPEADGWLEQQGSGAKEWMMRRAAFDSLRARDPARATKLAETLAGDEYPRVRAATLEVLASGASWTRVAQLAQSDSWPLVRVAGARALSSRTEARSQLEGLIADPSPRVRVAAIDSLTVQKAREAWPAVEARLKAQDEYPEVASAAVAYARELCLAQAQEPLTVVVRRSLRPDATDEAARLGVEALHALHDLGGAAAIDAKALATRPEAPPGLAKAYQNFRPPACEKAP